MKRLFCRFRDQTVVTPFFFSHLSFSHTLISQKVNIWSKQNPGSTASTDNMYYWVHATEIITKLRPF